MASFPRILHGSPTWDAWRLGATSVFGNWLKYAAAAKLSRDAGRSGLQPGRPEADGPDEFPGQHVTRSIAGTPLQRGRHGDHNIGRTTSMMQDERISQPAWPSTRDLNRTAGPNADVASCGGPVSRRAAASDYHGRDATPCRHRHAREPAASARGPQRRQVRESCGADPELRADVFGADIVGVDGMGILIGARLLGIKVPERVAGVDLMEQESSRSAPGKGSGPICWARAPRC